MIRILFLLLFLISLSVSAQTQEKKVAYKFFEYEKISDKLLGEKTQSFCAEINKTDWVGFIINYGSPDEIKKREKQIVKNFENYDCRKEFPAPRMTFLRIENENKSKTELWIVPPGEKPPITENK
jgi:hypothetical protein